MLDAGLAAVSGNYLTNSTNNDFRQQKNDLERSYETQISSIYLFLGVKIYICGVRVA